MSKLSNAARMGAFLVAIVTSASVHAELLTDPLAMQPGAVLATMDSVVPGSTSSAHASIGGIPGVGLGVQALNGALAVGTGASGWSLGSNGQWSAARSFVGVDGGADAASGNYAGLMFEFGGMRVQQVGALLNFNPDFTYGASLSLPLYLAAYDARGELLDSHEVKVSTPGGIDVGVYFGIALSSPLIARFEVSGPYAVVDDLRFSSPVPEARALWLALVGIGVLALVRAERRR